jgi:hypothetical protein
MNLPVSRIDELPLTETQRWLIEGLWLERACGLIGGQPKCCKTWLGLEMMLAVASGAPCLGRFPIPQPGPVLLYLAEDHPAQIHKRLCGLAAQKGISLSGLPLYIILAPTLQLDAGADKEHLAEAIQTHKPRAVLLDPLVRLHALDENSARDMAALLGYFRQLERTYQTAILLTHHMTKRASRRPGQGLRGSGDLHAFGDSNLYLSRNKDAVTCTVEHRHAQSHPDFSFRLQGGEDPALELLDGGLKSEALLSSLSDRIVHCLSQTPAGLTRAELRSQLAVNNQKLGIALRQLQAANHLSFNQGLYTQVGPSAPLGQG